MVIDFHTHVFPSFFRDDRTRFFREEPAFELIYNSPKSKLVGRKELLRSMDQEGVHRSVIFGFPWEQADHFRRHNDYIMESVQRHPDRLTGFCSFSPASEQAPREVERCLSSGLSGVGELAMYASGITEGDIARFEEMMGICTHFDVPLLLHTNEPVGHDYSGKTPMTLRQLYNFLRAFPKNRIVLAHWGGGLFFYALMKKEVRDVLRNVWFDTAASPYLYTPRVFKLAGEIIGNKKILFGSDYPLLKPGRYFKEMKTARLSSEAYQSIVGGNAARLLRLAD